MKKVEMNSFSIAIKHCVSMINTRRCYCRLIEIQWFLHWECRLMNTHCVNLRLLCSMLQLVGKVFQFCPLQECGSKAADWMAAILHENYGANHH